jgi:hypothetical protein
MIENRMKVIKADAGNTGGNTGKRPFLVFRDGMTMEKEKCRKM